MTAPCRCRCPLRCRGRHPRRPPPPLSTRCWAAWSPWSPTHCCRARTTTTCAICSCLGAGTSASWTSSTSCSTRSETKAACIPHYEVKSWSCLNFQGRHMGRITKPSPACVSWIYVGLVRFLGMSKRRSGDEPSEQAKP